MVGFQHASASLPRNHVLSTGSDLQVVAKGGGKHRRTMWLKDTVWSKATALSKSVVLIPLE